MDIDRWVFPLVHAFEPLAHTFATLEMLQKTMPLCNLHLHHAAVSNNEAHGTTARFVGGAAGDESAHLADPHELSRDDAKNSVPVLSIDRWSETLEPLISHWDYVHIDTEGHDPNVLKGLHAHLSAHRISMLAFEYVGGWPGITLQQQISVLDTQYGYDCYYLVYDALIKLSGGCWTDQYETRQQSNIFCLSRKYKYRDVLTAPLNVVARQQAKKPLQLFDREDIV